jgi:hypothetical protein
MSRPAPTDRRQIDSLLCQLDAAIRGLERFAAEQREIARRRGGAGVGLVCTGRRRRSDKADAR